MTKTKIIGAFTMYCVLFIQILMVAMKLDCLIKITWIQTFLPALILVAVYCLISFLASIAMVFSNDTL